MCNNFLYHNGEIYNLNRMNYIYRDGSTIRLTYRGYISTIKFSNNSDAIDFVRNIYYRLANNTNNNVISIE